MKHFGNWTEDKTACGEKSRNWTDNIEKVTCSRCIQEIKKTAIQKALAGINHATATLMGVSTQTTHPEIDEAINALRETWVVLQKELQARREDS